MTDPPPTGRHDAEAVLAQVPLFAELPPDTRRELARSAAWVHVAGGEFLFHQGDAADSLALVWSGRLQVVDERATDGDGIDDDRQAGAPGLVIGILGRGSSVGELSLLTGEPRAAGIRALDLDP